MGVFDGVLFTTDMDGTLLRGSDSSISEENVRAAEYFMSEGGRFCFATGRLPSELGEYNSRIHTNAPCICANGALLCDLDTGECSLLSEIGEDIIPFIEKIHRNYPGIMLEIDSCREVQHIRILPVLEKQREISSVPFKKINAIGEAEHPWVKIAFWGEEKEVEGLVASLPLRDIPRGFVVIKTYKYCAELIMTERGKEAGLIECRKRLPGIRIAAAVGDHGNDIEMLKCADIGFAVGNAIDGAKKAADVILSRDCNHSAVAEAIETLEKMLRGEKSR